MWGSTAAALPTLVCCPWHSELSPVTSLWGGVLGTSVRSYSSSFAIARQHLQGLHHYLRWQCFVLWSLLTQLLTLAPSDHLSVCFGEVHHGQGCCHQALGTILQAVFLQMV